VIAFANRAEVAAPRAGLLHFHRVRNVVQRYCCFDCWLINLGVKNALGRSVCWCSLQKVSVHHHQHAHPTRVCEMLD